MPWKKIFKDFATAYQWGPDQVLRLTFWQLRMYLSDEAEAGGTVAMSPAQAMAIRATKIEERREDVARHLIRHGPRAYSEIPALAGVDRFTAREVLTHPWFAQTGQSWDVTADARRELGG